MLRCLGVMALFSAVTAYGQFGPGPSQPRTGKAAALYDIAGYWVSVVTEDWRYRMATPLKGDYSGILLNPAGRKIADAWDPAKYEAAGEQCRSYGAPSIMRVPGRLRIAWRDDNTLRIDADNGRQSRILRFDSAETGGGDWQGYSKASWESVPARTGQPAGRIAKSGDHPTAPRLSAQERSAVQRKYYACRISRPGERTRR